MPSEGVDDGSYPGAKQGKAGLFSVECEVCGREYDTREEVAEDHRPGCSIRRALEARGQTAEQLDEERDLRVMTDGGKPLEALTDEELGELVRNTAAFRAAAACARFADEARELRDNDSLAWDRLIKETHAQQATGVSRRSTTRDIVETFVDVVEEHAELSGHPADAAERAAEDVVEERDARVMTDGGIQTDLHPSRQTSLSEADEESDAHEWCPGPDGLEEGELPCWDCFAAASQEQREAYNEHPDTPTVRLEDDEEGRDDD